MEEVDRTTIEENKRLIREYPFLLPRNRYTDLPPKNYDYAYTELDALPSGWRIAFGEDICREIKEELDRVNYTDRYRIAQIKEKFGSLRWYDFGATAKITYEIIPKYTEISRRTCITCGKPASLISRGWISPFCEECIQPEYVDDYIAIEDYYD